MKPKTITSLLIIIFLLSSCVPDFISTPIETDAPVIAVFPTETVVPFPTSTLHFTSVPVLKESHVSGWVVYSVLVNSQPWATQIFLKNLDTGTVTQLTDSHEHADHPIWSPDGTQILYVSWSKENSYDIYLMDKNGKNKRPLVGGPSAEYVADWSPNGKKVAYVSSKNGDSKIFVVDLQTQTVIKLTNDSMRGFSPKWSSDGKQIAFISNSSDNKLDARSQVFIMNADGTNIRQMMEYDLDNFDDRPVWCPDDSCIIFTRHKGPLKLMILDISSKSVTTFLDKVFGSEIQEADIARSPKSGYMTFLAGETFYAMDMKTREIYPLDVKGAFHLSLYP